MIAGKSILAFVMAGGEGNRLYPLTAHRSKPSVPFGGRHRIVDFVLSNLVNSEINAIYLLVQYKSQSLIEHIRKSWSLTPFIPQHFVTVVPPQMHHGPEWFQGTADSVFQNLHLIDIFKPDLVAVFGADHIYRMDVRQMVEFHVDTGADVSVAALPVPLELSSSFGIIHVDEHSTIRRFEEKPLHAPSMPGKPGFALASMGNYIFDTQLLMDALRQAHASGESDFGRDVLPRLTRTHKVVAYDFNTNAIPGLREYEERGYWRDVGTIEAYFDAHFDVIGATPKFKLTNIQWPIFASPSLSESAQVIQGRISDSVLGTGSMIRGARVNHSVLRREVLVEEDAELDDCIVMEKSTVGRGAKLRRTIVDQYNVIAPGERIGFDLEADRKRFHVSDSGIVVIGRGQLKG